MATAQRRPTRRTRPPLGPLVRRVDPITFINALHHTKGPFARTLFNLRPWQQQYITRLFERRRDGLRRYRTNLLMLPRKNGKSEIAAAIALYALMADGEIGGEVYSAAADKEQASLVFNVVAEMIRLDPFLSARCEIIDSKKRIVHRDSGSFYRAISAEAYCVAPDVLIEMADGRRLRADEVRAGDQVIGWDGVGLAIGTVRSVASQEPTRMLRIVTRRGRSIAVTGGHKFLAMAPGRRPVDMTHRYEWVQADQLSVGARIRVGLGDTYLTGRGMSDREAWALGAWVGDGDCGHFRFTNTEDEIVVRMREHLESIGSRLESFVSLRQRQSGRTAYPGEHQVLGVGRRRPSPGREWIRRHIGQASRARTKRVPAAVWTSGPSAWAAFLAGWLDTDGCIPASLMQASWCSMSDGLLQDGQALLARLGINACLNDCHTLTVNGREQLGALAPWLMPRVALSRKRELLGRCAERSGYSYRGHDSDLIESIEDLGAGPSVSLDVDGIDTHVTNGIITHNSKHGFNASVVIYDELHAAPNRELWDVLATSQSARANPLMIAISTAGFDKHSILYELYSYAKRVLERPSLDPTFLPIIYEAPEDADWLDTAVWHACNPALGDFRSLDEMRMMAARAQEIPAQENAFRRLYLNQWTEQEERWLQMTRWDACQGETAIPTGAKVFIGLDLASTQDVAAAVVINPRPDGTLAVEPHFWVPADSITRRSLRDRVPYDLWARQGLITATPGSTIDYSVIRADLNELAKRYHVVLLGYDQWNAESIRQQLDADGITTVKIAQTIGGLNEATKRLGDLVADRGLVHDGNEVLRWMASNATVTTDANGNMRPDKQRSLEKIDGIVALIIAIAAWLTQPVAEEPQYQVMIL